MTTWHGWRHCWIRHVRCRTAPTNRPGCPAASVAARQARCVGRTVYRHALQWALLPRLMWRLETQLRGNLNRADFLYEATRVYLMLGNAGPLDASLVREWMRLDWQAAYPGLGYAPLRDSLLQHLDALLAEPLPQIQLDGALVTAARARIATVPLAQRVYSRIKPSAAAQRLPPWRPSDALGPAGLPLFVRASGKPLTDGVPGFFTVDGFHKVLLPSLGAAAKSVISESWVLGGRVAFDPNGPQMQALERDVVYSLRGGLRAAWDLMMADLNVVQLRSLSQAAQDLYILASPKSPMRKLLASISRQLTLSVRAGARAAGCRVGCTSERHPVPAQYAARCIATGHARCTSAARPRDRRTLPGAARLRQRQTRRADRSGAAGTR